jgi:post-segregation antitoxin (ccd killing protein)
MRPDLVTDGQLPEDLKDYLINIERLVEKADGVIQSRQVVALALATWEQLKKCDM